jgi:hypothetical protein
MDNFEVFPISNTFNFSEIAQNLSHLMRYWQNPSVRFEKLVFSSYHSARTFLTQIPATPWFAENNPLPNRECGEICHKQELETELSLKMEPIQKIALICSVDTAYELDRVLAILGNSRSIVHLEILCEDNMKAKESLVFFLQDKLPELNLPIPPRCSLVKNNFEIVLTENSKPIRKRTRKPGTEFQRLLKKITPHLYPAIIGNEYYGRQVFESYLKLWQQKPTIFSQNGSNKVLLPPSPMKYYDLLAEEGQIEIRFDQHFSPNIAQSWIQKLENASSFEEKAISMARIGCYYDSWQEEPNFATASKDQFFITWNDFEFGFKARFEPVISYIPRQYDSEDFGLIFYKLTPYSEEPDFRFEILHRFLEYTKKCP